MTKHIDSKLPISPGFLTFLVLFLIPVSQIAVDIYLPSLPSMTKSLNATSSQVQLTFTFYLIGLGISQLIYGPFTDRLGRRPILFFGTILFFLSSILCVATHNVFVLYIGRSLQGLGGGAIFVVTNAILADVFTGQALAKRVTYGSLTWSLVPILAPAIGGFVQEYIGWKGNFYIMIIYTAIALLLSWFFLPETLNKEEAKTVSIKRLFISYIHILVNPRFISLILAVILGYGAVIVFNIVAPFLLQNLLHVSASMYGVYVLVVGLSYTVGTFLNGVLLRYYYPLPLITFGSSVIFGSGIALLIFSLNGWFDVLSLLLATCILQVGQGFVFANCLSGSLAIFPKLGGLVSSLYGSLLLLGVMAISAVVAHVQVSTQFSVAITYSILGGLALLALLPWWVKKSKNQF